MIDTVWEGLRSHAVEAVTRFHVCVLWFSVLRALRELYGTLCIAGILQVFPSWSLERQAGENKKRKKAGGGHYFLMRFLTSSPFVLRAGTKETGREGGKKRVDEQMWETSCRLSYSAVCVNSASLSSAWYIKRPPALV